MSISSMANGAMARRPDFAPARRVPRGFDEMAEAAAAPTGPVASEEPAPAQPAPPAPPGPGGGSSVSSALQVITTYIPTEVLTLYVAVVSALQAPGEETARVIGGWTPFWSFLALTPVVVWLVYAAKVKAAAGDSRTLPLHPSMWPLWEMTAATMAYTAWAIALPNSPFLTLGLPPGIAAVIVLVTSTLLGLLAPVFQRPLKA